MSVALHSPPGSLSQKPYPTLAIVDQSVPDWGGRTTEGGFTEFLIGEGLKGKTVTTYLRHVHNAAQWLGLHGHTLASVPPSLIAAWGDTLANSHSTKATAATALRYYWIYTGRAQPPIRALRIPPEKKMVCQALEVEEATRLKGVALGQMPRGKAVLLGLFLALRCEEIAKAEWGRFTDDGQWYRVTGKFDKTADVPVSRELWRLLEPYRLEGWIFPGRTNVRAHVAPATIWFWVKRMGEQAGISDLRTHQLRHTSLAHAHDRTGDLRAVMEFARHVSPETTRGYTRTTKEALQGVAASLDF